MLNTLMDITEAEAGMMKLQPEPVDLCQLVREVGGAVRIRRRRKEDDGRAELPAACEASVDRNPDAAGVRQPARQRHQIHA